MAPSAPTMEDFNFIMTCYKHFDSKPKVNFEAVAAELGAKSGNACYHRHWAILKKWGLAGDGPTAGKAKRATPSKRKVEKSEDAGDDDDTEASSAKKAKSTPRKKKAAQAVVKDEEALDAEEGADGEEGA
ncbi:hypothetical protein H2200_012011 [Cladophialophora chaetospira]|uniref:Myb-like DNA-binding domain-containing protein n=1 Tax=Cladophialophora chaetospira TaxID=386627 RepID=A0AA38WZ61_9EURO|nr:hypothetical protein H2200_012011 [Cladophialophora chaetospira]